MQSAPIFALLGCVTDGLWSDMWTSSLRVRFWESHGLSLEARSVPLAGRTIAATS